MFASPRFEKNKTKKLLHEYSSLILQHHLLFRESRWEGWSDGGMAEWEEGVEGGGEIVGCVSVCVRACTRVKDD